MERWGSTPTD